jgi:(3R)-3-hydroxyacyl-CoA dehydrogenase / 3a,7a,12a-trihydroxy-5b-cholest-24-enoyl-CoA hydratase / enoyl-CoA hydratase 2
MTTSLTSTALPNGFDLSQVLHGEQYLEVLDDLGTSGTLITKGVVVDVMDKKSGALLVTECNSYDPSGKQVIRNQSATFVVGAGNFGGKSKPSPDVIPTQAAPDRSPDFTVDVKTDANQAAIYRLSGDYNPLHIDPNFSSMAGYKIPILHGLCTLGVSVKAVIKKCANNDASLFKAVKTRFTKPVIPGQTLRISMWKSNRRIHFKTTVVETGNDVLSGGYVDLKNTVGVNPTSAGSLKSDAVFEGIRDRVADNPDKAKSVNGIFLYKITLNGKVTKEWTLDCKKGVVYDGPVKDGKADTTLTVADEDMVDIALGKLNPQTAFMKGKLKVTGNIMLTQKLVPLLKTEAKL